MTRMKFEVPSFSVGVQLSRNEMKSILGGSNPGGCSYTTIQSDCTRCDTSSGNCKCRSGVGLPTGVLPGCINIPDNGPCWEVEDTGCHG